MEKQISEEDMVKWMSLVEDAIRSRQLTLLRTVNGGMLELFWNIGKLLNNSKDFQKNRLAEPLSALLVAKYGKYFTSTNLPIMQDFAESCPQVDLREIGLNVGWQHLTVLMRLAYPSDWLYYADLVQRYQLDATELAEKIKTGNLVAQKKREVFFPTRLDKQLMEKYMEISSLHQFFGENGQEDFRKLFELPSVAKAQDQGVIGQLLHLIDVQVDYFRQQYHHILYLMGTAALEYIAVQLSAASKALFQKLDVKTFINHVAERFNGKISSQWLENCLASFQSLNDKKESATKIFSQKEDLVHQYGKKQTVISLHAVGDDGIGEHNIFKEPDIMFLLANA